MVKKFLNSKLGQQIMKFGVVGLLCFAIEYVLLIVIKEVLGWNVILANTIAFTVSAVVNYIPVSYTHLDVYKRQVSDFPERGSDL